MEGRRFLNAKTKVITKWHNVILCSKNYDQGLYKWSSQLHLHMSFDSPCHIILFGCVVLKLLFSLSHSQPSFLGFYLLMSLVILSTPQINLVELTLKVHFLTPLAVRFLWLYSYLLSHQIQEACVRFSVTIFFFQWVSLNKIKKKNWLRWPWNLNFPSPPWHSIFSLFLVKKWFISFSFIFLKQ